MNKLLFAVAEKELLELQEILLDDDAPAALRFLKTRIAPQIPAKGTANCDSSRRNPFLLKEHRW